MSARLRMPPLPLIIALWCAWFVVLYGGHAVGCAVAAPAPEAGIWNPLNGALLLLTLITFAVLARLALGHCRAGRAAETAQDRLGGFLNGGTALVAAVATLVIGAPLVVYPACL